MANIPALNSLASYINGTRLFANPNAGQAIASVAGAESGGYGGRIQGQGIGSDFSGLPNMGIGSGSGIGLFQDTTTSRQAGMVDALGQAAPASLSGVQSQGAFAISEIEGGGYNPTLNVLNDPNASMSDMQSVLTTNFEKPLNPTNDITTSAVIGNQLDQGTASPDTVAPNGNSFDPNSGMFDSGSALAPGLTGSGTTGYNAFGGQGSGLSTDNSGIFDGSPAAGTSGIISTGSGDITGTLSAGVNPVTGPSSVGATGSTPGLGSQPAPTDTTTTPGDAQAASVPTAIATGFNTLTQGLGKAIASASGTASNAITGATTSANNAANTFLNSIFGNVGQWFERAGLGLLAIVLIALAVIFIALNSRSSSANPINITLAAVP